MPTTQPTQGNLKLSIIVPVLNGKKYIRDTIKSLVRLQKSNAQGCEIIFQNGFSTDGTTDIIDAFCSNSPDTFHYNETDAGQSDAINKGVSRANGEWVTWLCADDILLPDLWKSLAEADRAEVDVVYGDVVFLVDKQAIPAIGTETHLAGKLARNRLIIQQPGTCIRRSVWNDAGGVNPKLNWMMDYDLFLRLECMNRKFYRSKRFVAAATIHKDAKTSSGSINRLLEIWSILMRSHNRQGRHFRLKPYYVYLFEYIIKNVESRDVSSSLKSKLLSILHRIFWLMSVPNEQIDIEARFHTIAGDLSVFSDLTANEQRENELMSLTAPKNDQPDVDIVIPTYNGSGHIANLLESIKKQTYHKFTCFVIDDSSKDETVDLIKENYPWVNLIEQNQNNGPAMNRNIAIGLGHSPYIVIFDDDTFLKDRSWLTKAIRKIKDNPNIGQLATMIVSGYDESILLDCGISGNGYIFGGLFHQENIDRVEGKHLVPRRALGACSASTVLRRDVFEKAGGFDPKYFYPSEDLDLSLRIHLMGYDVFYEPSLVTYHYESQAMGKNNRQKVFMHRRNCLLAYAENYPIKQVVIALAVLFLNKVIISPLSLKTRKYKNRNEIIIQEGITDYRKSFIYLFKNIDKIYFKRKNFDQMRTKPRKYLFEIH